MRFFPTLTQRVFLAVFTGVVATILALGWVVRSERREFLEHSSYRQASVALQNFFSEIAALPPEQYEDAFNRVRRFGIVARWGHLADLSDVVPDSPLAQATRNVLPGYDIRSTHNHGCRYLLLPSDNDDEHDDDEHEDDDDNKHRVKRLHDIPRVVEGDDLILGILPSGPRGLGLSCEDLLITMPSKHFLRLSVLMNAQERHDLVPLRYHVSPRVIWLLVVLLPGLLLLAYGVAKMATASVRSLADAANSLGQDINAPPLKEQGGREVRQAIRAFNSMQQRIATQIKERTEVIAAITHDLQTQLTRMRLRLEKIVDPLLREQLITDLANTQKIVREGLEWAKSRVPIHTQPLEVEEVLGTLMEDNDLHNLRWVQKEALPEKLAVIANQTALKRALQNLVDNAIRYGKNATLSAHSDKQKVEIWVEDQGEGIPEESLKQVFEPYVRLESSRSSDTGGSGLGLSIARNFVEAMGGTITLENRTEGGVRARVCLLRA